MPFSEQDIRAKAVAFLRHHYRNRERHPESGTRVQTKPHWYQGAKIDARFAYERPDRTTFTATIEATSVDRSGEIIYQLNHWRIFTYSLATTLVLMAVIVWGSTLFHHQLLDEEVIGYVGDSVLAETEDVSFNWFEEFGRPFVWGYLLGLFAIIGFLAYSFWQFQPRFRYIYAIEQFKQFYVDDQWVAFDEMVFFGLKDIYHDELRRQCILHGFGLIRINEEGRATAELNPSHLDQFAGERVRLPDWVAKIQAPPALRNLRKRLPAGPIVAALPPATEDNTGPQADPLIVSPYLPLPQRSNDTAIVSVPPRPGRLPWYRTPKRQVAHLRYAGRRSVRRLMPPGYEKQPNFFLVEPGVVFWGLLGLSALVFTLYRQSHYDPQASPGSPREAPSLYPLEPAGSPEESDAQPYVLEGEYQKQGRERDLELLDARDPRRGVVVIDEPTSEPNETDIMRYRIREDGEVIIEYDCVPADQLSSTVYYIQEQEYPYFSAALRRGRQLHRQLGVSVTVVESNCLAASPAGYTVYLYDLTDNEGTINFLYRQLANRDDTDLDIQIVKLN